MADISKINPNGGPGNVYDLKDAWARSLIPANADPNTNMLATMADVGGSYVLPTASSSTLGGVKVGNRLSITQDGTLSADNQIGDSSSGLVKSVADIQDVIPSDASSSNKLITQAQQGGKKFIKQVTQIQGSSTNFYLEFDEIKYYDFIYIAMHAKDINNNITGANNSYSQLIMIYIKPFIDNIDSITVETTDAYAHDITNRNTTMYTNRYKFNYILKRLYVYPNLFNYNVENIADVYGD